MKEDLRKRILSEIGKSGIPLELKVVESLRAAPGLRVRQNVRYEVGGQVSEIDVLASIGSDDLDRRSHEDDRYVIDLVIECKSSAHKPWVFFEEPADPISTFGLVQGVSWYTDLRFEADWGLLDGCQNTPLARHHYGSPIPIARSYFEAFRKDAGQDIYKAIKAVERGKAHLSGSVLGNIWRENHKPPWFTRLIHGVIVFEGTLAVAKSTDGSFDVEDVQHVLLRSDNLPSLAGSAGLHHQNEVVIDIVHADGLGRYLELLQRDLESLSSHMRQLRRAGAIRAPFV